MINNEFVPSRSGAAFDAVDPTTESVLAAAASGDEADVDAAVTAARAALENGPWATAGPHDRARVLRRFAEVIVDNADELAHLETLNNGTPIGITRGGMTLTADRLQYFAGAAPYAAGQTMPSPSGRFTYTLREPVGVCAGIIPWNSPVSNAVKTFGPALAAGNTVILKPAEQTPLSAIRLAELAIDAGLPPGVFNVITGFGKSAGAALVRHPGVNKLNFTGSLETGRQVAREATANLKRVTLELGGKSPNIIFADADLSKAVPAAVNGFSKNAGQMCTAGSRLFVHESIREEFIDRIKEQLAGLTLGNPLDPQTTMGPLVSRQQMERVERYVEVGKAEGANIRFGGSPISGPGYFVEPTVFDQVNSDMRIAVEEIFGPVLSVISFTDEDEVVRQANESVFGLGAGVWTQDISRAHRLVRRLQAGTVWVNAYNALDVTMPFGGQKQSGIGRELGLDWYREFTEEKAVLINL
ncbi:MAG: aldehyde dehydrogenase family protein [Rhodococcus sp. (in: high G+C Gram-positive bacteria)]|nr:MAG: aldehyde dehydrogenase family protein [Rhodococcus sp. (in: high G+C Gram-positive bacteria)]